MSADPLTADLRRESQISNASPAAGPPDAKAALRDSDRFAWSALDSLTQHIAILDADGTILETNRSWRLFAEENGGSMNHAYEGTNYLKVCDGATGTEHADAQRFAAGLRDVLAGVTDQFSLEYPCHSPTQQRWFLGRVTRFVGEGPTRLVVTHENVTDRVLALHQLRDSKVLLNEVERTAQLGGWEVNLATRAILWTEEVARIHGVDRQRTLTLEEALTFYVGDSRRMVAEAIDGALRHGQAFDLDLEFRSADGEPKWVRVIANPEVSDGQVVRLAGFIRDITERRQDHLARQESEELFSKIFYATPVAMNLFRMSDGRSILVNEEYLTLTGYTREEVVGHTATELGLFDDPELRPRILRTLQAMGTVCYPDIELRTKSGEIRNIVATAHTVMLKGENAAIVVATDMTERKRAEVERKALEEQLRHAQKMEAIGRLAGGIAHDFNNLLQVINAYSEMITEDYAHDPRLLHDGQAIHHAGQTAANLTRQLLSFSRKAPIEPRCVELDPILAGMADMIRRLVGADVTVQLNLSAPGRWIDIDPSQVEQIVMNLAVNARDAMPEGGLLIFNTASGDPRSGHPREVELTVVDSGQGMDPETQKRAFEPFFTTKPLGRGTGLGLSTVYGIVQQCSGRIEVTSQIGTGTEFHVYFPLVEERSPAADPPGPAKGSGRQEQILVVEDDHDLRVLYRQALEISGYGVFTATTGREALDLLQAEQGRFDLVVSDSIMPVMGGIELFERLRKTHPRLKLLLISGYTGDRVDVQGALPRVDLLSKPFPLRAFVGKIRQLLDDAPPNPA